MASETMHQWSIPGSGEFPRCDYKIVRNTLDSDPSAVVSMSVLRDVEGFTSQEGDEGVAAELLRLVAEVRRLRAVLDEKEGGWSIVAHYDEMAERFRLETGIMAPGKAYPLAAGEPPSDEARNAAWIEWLSRQPEV